MTATTTIHASCVAVDGKGLLITGASGSGKSALALQLMAFGAHLIADDRVKRMITILGQNLPLFLKVEGLHFAPSLLQLLRSGAMSI